MFPDLKTPWRSAKWSSGRLLEARCAVIEFFGVERPAHYIYDAVVSQRFPREPLIKLPLPLFTRSLSPFHLPAPNNFLLRPALHRQP